MRRYIFITLLLSMQLMYADTTTSTSSSTSSTTSLADLFGMADQLQAGAKEEEDTAAAQVAQYQTFFMSSDYENVISLMNTTGVMDTFNEMIQTLRSGSDVDQSDMSSTVSTLTALFTSMLNAYIVSGLPILATSSNAAYSFYTTVMLLYIARLRYLSEQVIATAGSGVDYSDALSALFDAYDTYDSSLQTLADNFPTTSATNTQLNDYYATLATLAIEDFYTQVSVFILPDLISAVESSMSSAAEYDDQATWAINIYQNMMSKTDLQTGFDNAVSPDDSYDLASLNNTAVTLYSSFDDYQQAFLDDLYSVCKSAVNYLNGEVDFVSNPVNTTTDSNPNEVYLESMNTICSDMAALFKDVDSMSSDYKQIVSWQTDAANKINAFDEALKLIDSTQSDCESAASSVQTLTKSTDLNALIGTIQSAASDCTTAQSDLTLLGDATSIASLQAIQYSLSALYWLAYMKYYWTVFLEDADVGGAALATVAQSFNTTADSGFTDNLSTIISAMEAVVCMQSVTDSCSSSSANIEAMYNSGFDLSKFMTSVMSLTSADNTVSSTNATVYYDVNTLADIQKMNNYLTSYGQAFADMSDALQTIDAAQISKTKLLLANVMVVAKQIDDLYSADSALQVIFKFSDNNYG